MSPGSDGWGVDFTSRDAFDTALVVVALGLVVAEVAGATDPVSVAVGLLTALVSLDPLVYLLGLGLGGILFLAYGLLYLPTRAISR